MEKKEKREPAKIDLEKWMKPAKSYGEEVPVLPNDCIVISNRLLPEVYAKLKGLGKVERIYQTAIINAALIMYLDKKEKELGIDLASFSSLRENLRPNKREIESAMPKEDVPK